MKNFIKTRWEKLNADSKRTTSKIVLLAFLTNILAPTLTYASLPAFSNALAHPNVPAVAQISEVKLPRDLAPGDVLDLTISGSTLTQAFSGSSLGTAEALNAQIDSLTEVTSVYDDSLKAFTITSEQPGIPFAVGNLHITRQPVDPMTLVQNVVAVAQQSELSVPQDLFQGDIMYFTLEGVSITQNFTGDTDTTLSSFAQKITDLAIASGSYDSSSKKIKLSAKTPGVGFSMSDLVIVSTGIPVTNITPNVAPIAQVEEVAFPRIVYPDETISITLSGTTITQSYSGSSAETLVALSSKINDLGFVSSSISAGVFTITSLTPGEGFVISPVTITGGTINGINIVPNQIAVAQEESISVPRDVFMGDTINLTISGTTVSQGFTMNSDYTIGQLVAQINALPDVGVSGYNSITRSITIQSKIPGTSFGTPTLNITTSINSENLVENVAAQKQVSDYTLPRDLVPGDQIFAIINGSPLTVDFSTGSTETLDKFVQDINVSNSGVISAVRTGNRTVEMTAVTGGIGFTAQNLNITNTFAPVVIVPNTTPTKQKETITFNNQILPGDILALSLSGETINTSVSQAFDTDEATTLADLSNQINALADFTSSVSGNKVIIESKKAGAPISVTDISTTGQAFTSSGILASSPEVNASISLQVTGAPASGESISIGSCTITFSSTGSTDSDCSDGVADLNINGISDINTISTIIRGVTGISDPDQGLLTSGGSGDTIVFTAGSPANTTPIASDISGSSGSFSIPASVSPVLGVAQVDSLTIPRSFVPGDTFRVVIDGITVTQNFLSSAGITFDNLVTQLNALPNISATGAGNEITLTAKTPGVPFIVNGAQLDNNTTSVTSVSNVVAVAQSDELDFPTLFVAGDVITISIDGTQVTQTFDTDHPTTLVGLVSKITSDTSVDATASGSLGMVLTAKTPGNSFVVDKLEVKNTTPVTSVTGNLPGVAQVDALVIPFTPTASDSMNVNINGNILTQEFVSDATTTFSALNTKINDLPQVNSSYDAASGAFIITSAVPGTTFTASFTSTGPTIASVNVQPNVESGAQVDTLTVNREVGTGDLLELNIAGETIDQGFVSDKVSTLQALNTKIDALSEVSSIFDGTNKFTITSKIPGTPFTGGVLSITSNIPSLNQVANVPAVAQVDKISIPRNLISGDRLSIDMSGVTVTDSFTGSSSSTLLSFATKINAVQSGAVATISGNDIVLTAGVAGVPFTATGFSLDNTSMATTTVANVTAVKKVSAYTIPALVAGDTLTFTIDSMTISGSFNSDEATTISDIISKIDATGIATGSFSGSELQMTAVTTGTPFTLSQLSIINTTPSTIKIPNVVPEAQVVNMYPAGTLREGITFRVTVNGTDYDYLTTPTDGVPQIIEGLKGIITNTGVTVGTGSDISGEFLQLTSSVPGIGFTYNSQALDITPPVITTPINIPQTLKSGSVSTSNVQINEDGVIYMVMSGTTITTELDITSAIANHKAFIAANPANAHSNYTLTVPAGLQDGRYDFIAVDQYNNVSQAIPGWLTVDNTAPVVNISTPAQTVNTDTIVINGTTEPNLPVQITGGVGIVNVISDGVGAFSGTVTLNQNVLNVLNVTATDVAGNIGSGTVNIIHDNINPQPFVFNAPAYTNSGSAIVSLQTETTTQTEIFSGATIIASGTTNSSGSISFTIPLALNTANTFKAVATDSGSNTSSGIVTIIQDSIAPNIILGPVPSIVHASGITLSGTTEPFASVVAANSGITSNTTADSLGNFSINVSLNQNPGSVTVNNIVLTATDLASNTGSTSVSITEDSSINSLIINTPSYFTSVTTITVSGSTKGGATVDISGGATPVSITASSTGTFSANVNLNPNSANVLVVTSTDQVGNVLSGSLTVTNDMIAPSVTITTPAHPTNSNFINITGTTEANSVISITGGSGSAAGVSTSLGTFNIVVELNPGVVNDVVVTAGDQAGNIGTGSISIFQDPIVNFLTLSSSGTIYTKNASFAFSGTTKSGAAVTVGGASGTLNLTADSAGAFSGILQLIPNSTNPITISSTDATLTTVTGGFIVINDTTAPTLSLALSGTINTNLPNIVLSGSTEAGALVTFSNGTSTISGNADSSGSFSITFPLVQNATNTITGTSADLAGNASSGVTLIVINDNIGPAVSSLVVNPAISGPTMNLSYTFQTNENSTSLFAIGTGSNVDATLVATGSTSGVIHNGVIPGLSPNSTYYYYIRNVDSFGNISQTPVATLNQVDTTGPVFISNSVSNITTTSASLDFSFSDANFNTGTLASGVVFVSGGTTALSLTPTLTFSNPINTGHLSLSNLTASTAYDYTITLKDDQGNQSTATGAFMTSTSQTGSTGGTGGTSTTYTGSVSFPAGTGSISLTGNLIVNSVPQTSGLGTGSISLSSGTTIIPTAGWNGTLSSPTLVDPNSAGAATNNELASLISQRNTSTTTYNGTVIETISVGGNTMLTATGGVFTITASLSSSQVGNTLSIFRSEDGTNWTANTPDATCTISSANTCTFRADALSYFALVNITGTQIPVSTGGGTGGGSGGGGGGGLSIPDYCPSGDFSPSYYDRLCGTKPATGTGTSSTGTTSTTGTGTGNIPQVPAYTNGSDLDQLANVYIWNVKQKDYPYATTTEQRIGIWQKVITEIDKKLQDSSLSQSQRDLYVAIENKARSNMNSLQVEKEAPGKVISGGSNQTTGNEGQGSATPNGISIYRYIEVDHTVVVRDFPSFKGNILDYLPRNYRVEVLESGNLWTKINYENGKTAYIRSKYLREENAQDRGRTASSIIFYDTSLQANVDMRKIKVAKSVWVRKGPGKEFEKETYLMDGDKVLILDAKTTNGWYEIRSIKGNGWVFGRYIEEDETGE